MVRMNEKETAVDFCKWAVINYACPMSPWDEPRWVKRAPAGTVIDPPCSTAELFEKYLKRR